MTSRDIPPDESGRVEVRTSGGDATWTLTLRRVDRDWSITLASGDRTWVGAGPDCFEALRYLRVQLDAEHIIIGVNGARPNAWSSGMQRDMGEGLETYLLEIGARGQPVAVRTLGAAPVETAGTVPAQDDFHTRWLAARNT
jgi:hypothetical protein